MPITKPLDLWDLFVVKLAGQDEYLAIFFFLSLIIITIMAAKFRMTAMAMFIMFSLFSYMVYVSTEAGSFTFFGIISVLVLSFIFGYILKRIID